MKMSCRKCGKVFVGKASVDQGEFCPKCDLLVVPAQVVFAEPDSTAARMGIFVDSPRTAPVTPKKSIGGRGRQTPFYLEQPEPLRHFYRMLTAAGVTIGFLILLCFLVLLQDPPRPSHSRRPVGLLSQRPKIEKLSSPSSPDKPSRSNQEEKSKGQAPTSADANTKETREPLLPGNKFELVIPDGKGSTQTVRLDLKREEENNWIIPVAGQKPRDEAKLPGLKLPLETGKVISPSDAKKSNFVPPDLKTHDPGFVPGKKDRAVDLLAPFRKSEPKIIAPPGKNKEKEKSYDITFMGAKGTGKRFCFILDRSGSMSASMTPWNPVTGQPVRSVRLRRIDVLKLELEKTLMSLPEGSEFSIVLFNHGVLLTPAGLTWRKGGTQDVPLLLNWIKTVQPMGNTLPTPAFNVAFKGMNPRPDVIFFMTDGEIPLGTSQQVIAMNNAGAKRCIINTIQFFGDGPYRNRPVPPQLMARMYGQMVEIAQFSGGNFHPYHCFLNLP